MSEINILWNNNNNQFPSAWSSSSKGDIPKLWSICGNSPNGWTSEHYLRDNWGEPSSSPDINQPASWSSISSPPKCWENEYELSYYWDKAVQLSSQSAKVSANIGVDLKKLSDKTRAGAEKLGGIAKRIGGAATKTAGAAAEYVRSDETSAKIAAIKKKAQSAAKVSANIEVDFKKISDNTRAGAEKLGGIAKHIGGAATKTAGAAASSIGETAEEIYIKESADMDADKNVSTESELKPSESQIKNADENTVPEKLHKTEPADGTESVEIVDKETEISSEEAVDNTPQAANTSGEFFRSEMIYNHYPSAVQEKKSSKKPIVIGVIAGISVCALFAGGILGGMYLMKEKNDNSNNNATYTLSEGIQEKTDAVIREELTEDIIVTEEITRSAPLPTAAKAEIASVPEENSWEELYAEQLRSYCRLVKFTPNVAMCDFADINSDGIPELIISEGEYHEAVIDIYTCVNSECVNILSNNGVDGTVSICPDEGYIIRSDYVAGGTHFMYVYEFTGNDAVQIEAFENTRAGDPNHLYFKRNESYISEEEYDAAAGYYTGLYSFPVGRTYVFDETVSAESIADAYNMHLLEQTATEPEPVTEPPVNIPADTPSSIYQAYYDELCEIAAYDDIKQTFLSDINNDGIEDMIIKMNTMGYYGYSIYSYSNEIFADIYFGGENAPEYSLYKVIGDNNESYVYYRYDDSVHSEQGYMDPVSGNDISVHINYFQDGSSVIADWSILDIKNNCTPYETISSGSEEVASFGDQPSNCHTTLLTVLNNYGFNISDSSGYTKLEAMSVDELKRELSGTENSYVPEYDAPIGYGYVITEQGKLNLRSAASTSSSVIAQIPKDEMVAIFEILDDWYLVSYGGHLGYVSRQYIDAYMY